MCIRDSLVVNSEVTGAEAQQAINLALASSVNPHLLPLYVPGNDRNVVNAVLEAKVGPLNQQAPTESKYQHRGHGDTLLPDESAQAAADYAAAQAAKAAMEAEEEAAKAEAAAAVAEAAAKRKAEAREKTAAFEMRQQAAREAQARKEEERVAKAQALKLAAKLKEERLKELEDKRRFFDKCDLAFHRCDRNQDGVLSRAEVIKALKKDIELPTLLHLPTRITTEQGAESQKLFEEAFQRMDIDHDRAVTCDEFKLFCLEMRSKQIAQCKDHKH
eukprot:TRINITY_DN12642_c0_g1_i2.p1 TRINITY_DN12642_c0_g1~~TRINITY_DN12642_c0_g1_i2.p1  ORF type:complete len:274 (+),score=85.33 TRINITY_DN12642_c0_g1_i2:79-900(+)